MMSAHATQYGKSCSTAMARASCAASAASATLRDGSILVSDDLVGALYRISYEGAQ